MVHDANFLLFGVTGSEVMGMYFLDDAAGWEVVIMMVNLLEDGGGRILGVSLVGE